MFSWVKALPLHPPESPIKPSPEPVKKPQGSPKPKPKSPKAARPRKESTSSNASGKNVLTWITESLTPPQPGNGKQLTVITRSDSLTSMNKEQGVLGRIVDIIDALETVVPLPQPPVNEEPEESNSTEVFDVDQLPDAENLPHIPAIEVESDEEVEEEEDDPTKSFPPRVMKKSMKKIKKTFENLVPQPEIYIRADGKVQKRKKKKGEAKPAEAEKVVGWIVQEFERILPQPVGTDGDQKRG